MSATPTNQPAVMTRLGRAARATTAIAGMDTGEHRERHKQTNWLRDVILGGQDGLVNILGIILGVIAGGGSTTVLLSAGFAAAITESISMGAVGYIHGLRARLLSGGAGTGGSGDRDDPRGRTAGDSCHLRGQ